ncbi:MAG: DUF1905 domain-containing protein [Bacteroidetes bacterium]|nr:DUF1905 domain-containing protein [Bacteroidota bacterium]
MADKPIVKGNYLLQKMQGKGGWTYTLVPKIMQDTKRAFNYVKVKGSIDGYEISKMNLMPMSGSKHHFLPVKAEIRKAIGKQAGDTVKIVLYHDNEPQEIPDEMMECMQDEPKALKFFNTLTDSQKKYYIQWVYGAKTEATRINRMATAINRMADGLKMYDTPPKDE